MKWNMVPVLGIACAVLMLSGCQRMSRTVLPDETPSRSIEEETFLAEPSDQKAPSADMVSDTEEGVSEKGQQKDLQEPKEASQEKPEEVEEPIRQNGEEDGRLSEQSAEGTGRLPGQNAEEAGKLPEQNKKETGDLPAEQPGDSPEKEETANQGSKVKFGAIQKFFHPMDTPPSDTVKYTDSQKKEITETKYTESVVDENDPSSYEVIEKEQEVPIRYVNRAGDIKYEYEDGIWYEYKYCSGNIMVEEPDEAAALSILNFRGDYDDFEVVSVSCTELKEEGLPLKYQYHVRYQRKIAMDKAPTELDNLAAVDLGIVAATMIMETEEKVPVLVEETVGTGEYEYYGWQETDEGTCYFDENGEKVTGVQVIQGIRHEFDEYGIKISKAGVEVSEANGEIDWDKVSKTGIDRAIIQCAYRESEEGVLTADAQAEKNLYGAGQAGLETGIFLFSQAVTVEEAVEEAEYLINTAKKYGVEGPIVITAAYANPEHNGRADGLEKEERTKYIAACCQRLREAGYIPMLHAEETFLTDNLQMEELSDCRLWLTAYGSDLTYTGSFEIWQYTDRGTVDGISKDTGLHISYGK